MCTCWKETKKKKELETFGCNTRNTDEAWIKWDSKAFGTRNWLQDFSIRYNPSQHILGPIYEIK